MFRGCARFQPVAVPIRSSVRFPLLIEHQNHAQNKLDSHYVQVPICELVQDFSDVFRGTSAVIAIDLGEAIAGARRDDHNRFEIVLGPIRRRGSSVPTRGAGQISAGNRASGRGRMLDVSQDEIEKYEASDRKLKFEKSIRSVRK